MAKCKALTGSAVKGLISYRTLAVTSDTRVWTYEKARPVTSLASTVTIGHFVGGLILTQSFVFYYVPESET